MSLAQQTFVAIHLANGRPDLAILVMRFPPELFAHMDTLLQGAWLAGAADAAANRPMRSLVEGKPGRTDR